MAEKKLQENPLSEEQPTDRSDKAKEMPKPASDKSTVPPAPVSTPHVTVPGFTKPQPNDLYRRLLPAVLFVLTFVTVMTMLLIYMDTVALGAQQFRVNMSRDYELASIEAGAPPLVAYVRQLHLAPRPPRRPPPVPEPTAQVAVMDRTMGEIHNGTFIEFLPGGPRSPTTLYLEYGRGWGGAVARAAARDFLALRGGARAVHACLSPTPHPREVSYSEAGSPAVFRSRVLCLPLYTLLLAAEATRAQLLLLGGPAALPALRHLPYGGVRLPMIEVRSSDPAYRNKTTDFLATKNYTVAAVFDDSVMYHLQETP